MQRTLKKQREPFEDTRETVAQIIADGCARLSVAGADAGADVATVRDVLTRATSTRVSAAVRERVAPRNRWRFLRRARRLDDIGRVFLQRLEWHNGTGSANLGASIFAAFDVGRETFDALDTIAAVYIHFFGRRGLNGSHSEKWADVLTGRGNGSRVFIIGEHSETVAPVGGFISQLSAYLERRKPKYFRFHVSGDYPTREYMARTFDVARAFPNVRFLAFSKRFEWFPRASTVPRNYSLIASLWPKWGTRPRGYRVAFMNDGTETRITRNALHCPGGCDNCGLCWNLRGMRRDVEFPLH